MSRGNPAGSSAGGKKGAVIGRDADVAVLRQALGATWSGSGRIVLVGGVPGIGKSALVRAALADLSVPVLSAAAEPLGRRLPLRLLADALGPSVGGTPAARSSGPLVGPGWRFGAGEVLLAALDALGPAIVVLEDLQWSDPESLELLTLYAATLATVPLLIVCTSRPYPERDELAALVSASTRHGVLRRVTLGPLGPSESLALAADWLGRPAGPRLEEAILTAEGNPLYIREILASLDQAGGLGPGPDGTTELTGSAPRASLQETVLSHLGYLSRETRSVLKMASVLGPSFGATELCRLTGRSIPGIVPILDEARRAGVLGEADDGRLEFVHDLVHDAIYTSMAATLRGGLHRDAARALRDLAGTSSVVAAHLLESDLRVEDFDWVAEVVDELVGRAPGAASELYQRQLELINPGDPRWWRTQAGVVATMLQSGAVAEAARLAHQLLDADPPAGVVGRLRSAMYQALLLQGRTAEVADVARRQAAEPGADPAEVAERLSFMATADALNGDRATARRSAEVARREARASGNRLALIRSLVAGGLLHANAGRTAEAQEAFDEAAALAWAEGTPEAMHCFAVALQALTLSDADQALDAAKKLAEAREAAETWGSAVAAHFVMSISSGLTFRAGFLDDAVTELETEWALQDEIGAGWQPVGVAQRALIALWADGPEAAEPWVQKVQGLAPYLGPIRGVGHVILAPAAALLACGDIGGAWKTLLSGWRQCLDDEMLMDAVVVAPDLVALAMECEEPGLAAEVAIQVAKVASRNAGVSSLAACAAFCRAVAARDADLLLAAARTHRCSPQRIPAARAEEMAARGLLRAGRRRDAEYPAARAVRLYQESGAGYEARRVLVEFSAAGLRLAGAPEPRRPVAGPGSLTPTEAVVARLVASGMSNPEIARRLVISRRTVETHVSHILAKLGMRSRTDVVLAVARGELRLPPDRRRHARPGG